MHLKCDYIQLLKYGNTPQRTSNKPKQFSLYTKNSSIFMHTSITLSLTFMSIYDAILKI